MDLYCYMAEATKTGPIIAAELLKARCPMLLLSLNTKHEAWRIIYEKSERNNDDDDEVL